MSELTVRTVTADDLRVVVSIFQSAFLMDFGAKDEEWFGHEFDPDRFHGAYDGDEMIGTAGVLTRNMTLPGAGPAPFAGVTSVAVKPGHRRRGAMTKLMHVQLHGLHDSGAEAFAALWASEGSIYGRFGYGLSSQGVWLSIPKGTEFRPGVDVGKDRVIELPRAAALAHMTGLYERVAQERTGWLSRPEKSWNMVLWDEPDRREGYSAIRFAVHPDGYATFRTKRKWGERGPEAELSVIEVVASSPTATAALWRYLLDYDHIGEITGMIATDDPLTHLLADPRQATRRHVDALWTRLVDVDRALVQRKYSAPLDTVFELTDLFCPWNQGRWRLTVDSTGSAAVERTTRDADLVLDVTDLGAAFLGGTRLTELAAAGRVRELRPGSLVPASRAFTGDRAPHCPEVF